MPENLCASAKEALDAAKKVLSGQIGGLEAEMKVLAQIYRFWTQK